MAGALAFGIQTHRGTSLVPLVERELSRLIPPGDIYTYHALAPVTAKADRSLRPISIALGVFGGVTLLAAILVAAQLVARRFRTEVVDREVLRALGANPADTVLDGLIGVEAAILLGILLAAGIAIALSPVAPLGPVRSVYPFGGIAFDWTVLGFGTLILFVTLTAIAFVLAATSAPHRVALRPGLRSSSGARIVAFVARAGLPAPGVVGVRMALEPGEGRSAVPVRSALLGSILAVALVVTTVIFGSSLQTLVSSPALYGWNWSYILNPIGSGGGNVPQVALTMLRHDPYVAAYSGASYNDVEIDGQAVPFLIENAGAPVTPPILSGQPVTAAHEIVLGAATLAQLGKHLGDYVTVTYGTPADAPIYVPPTRMRIVGTATLPAIGFASTVSDHTSMGTGVLLTNQDFPKTFAEAVQSGPVPALDGPNLALVRLKPDSAPCGSAGKSPADRPSVQPSIRECSRRGRWQRDRGPGRPAAGRDRQLQDDRHHADLARLRPRPRGHRGPRAHAPFVSPATPPRPCPAQDHGLRPPPTRCGRCVAGHRGCRGRHRRRRAARRDRGPLALDPVRRTDLRRSVSDRSPVVLGACRRGNARTGERDRGIPGADSCPHADGLLTPERIAAGSAATDRR